MKKYSLVLIQQLTDTEYWFYQTFM